jgi:hypothetical protein
MWIQAHQYMTQNNIATAAAQLYAGQPQLTVTQPRDWSNNDAMNVRVPVTGSLSLLGPGLLYLLLRKCGAA